MSRAPEKLADYLRQFAADYADLPLYHRLAAGSADDPDLLAILAEAQPGQGLPVLLLAAAHALVLDHPEDPVAQLYPSVTGDPVPEGDPFPPFRRFCLDHREDLVHLVATRSTQTNEPNRSIAVRALLGAAVADRPDQSVSLVELGASAGLNLLFDRYRMDVGDVVVGDARSPVRLAARAVGAPAPLSRPLVVGARCGIDREPVDVHDERAVRWLEACVWPEQLERLDRFRAAVGVARLDPPTVVEGDMVTDLEAAVAAGTPADSHLVVFHSWALVYVERARREVLAGILAAIADRGRPVTWVSAEGPGVVPSVEDPGPSVEPGTTTVLAMTRFRSGSAPTTTVVGRCHPHLAWIEWLA